MDIIETVEDLKEKLNDLKDKKVGFVPTMGYLHEGHLSLVDRAREENDLVVMSIFVNPLQFGPNEDFDSYPRDEKRDSKLAEEHGVDILFMPQADDMYPGNRQITMHVHEQANVLCGRSRKGHFDGVVTVLTKLFHMVNPTNAYFGMKDAQQLAVIHSLVSELNFPVNIVGLATVREEDGLAKSSRNIYLSDSERKDALSLYESLKIGEKLIQNGEKKTATIVEKVREHLEKTDGKIDYVELLSYPDLREIDKLTDKVILALAVQFNHARLIDNFVLNQDGERIQRFN